MLKKIYIVFITITLLLGICSNVNAAELKTTLEVIQKESEAKILENEQGHISKSIIESDKDKGEVTVELSLTNITNVIENTEARYENTEILIIVSENIARQEEKLNEYVSYIETLSNKIFDKSSNTKIGIVGIKGTVSDSVDDENGNTIWGENDEGDVNGSPDNAELILKPSSNSNEIKSSLKNMNSSKTRYRTNLQAAIRLANNSYSENVNKILICLYDGVPTIANDVNAIVSYGGIFSEYKTIEEAVNAQHEKIANKTKSEILTLKSKNVDFILLRPDDTSYDETWHNQKTGELTLEFDGSPYVQKIYGTLENPTYGKMYSLNNESLEKIVTENIYQDIIDDIRVDIKSAVIREYFSEDILKNFDITFDNENINTTELEENKYVEWNIGDLRGNQTAKLKYILKIKDMQNKDILNKILSTSEKTEMTYINYLNEETLVTSNSNPKIQLTEVKEELTATVTYDPTTNTTGKVTATIKTNKKVNEVDGWILSEDGMILTKEYKSNTTETVHLVDENNMTKDVEIKITNIIKEEVKQPEKQEEQPPKDDTTATGKIPQTGVSLTITITLIAIIIISLIIYKKYNSYKDIK